LFEIKSDNLEYAPIDAPCEFRVKLREQDNIWHCVHKTVIWDNWQNWFNEDKNNPSTFEHPTFLTCIEPRPRLVQSVRMALLLFAQSLPPLWFLAKEELLKDARRILGANKFVDAPLVYTYILNVAGRCGMDVDTIFNPGQDWENLCLYFPQAGSMYESNEDEVVSPSQIFNYENRWLVTLADLLDKLKVVFCAEWYVTPNNTIVFKYKKDLIQLAPIYDYTLIDSEKIYGLKYTFNGDKKPAYGNYQYATDGSDLASQEIDTLYSDIVDYDGPANNPMLEGELRKNFEFAATGFVRDGRSPDYMGVLIRDGEIGALILTGILVAIIVGLTISAVATLGLALAIALIFTAVAGVLVTAVLLHTSTLKKEFLGPTYSGAVRLTCEQVLTPRLLLWDGLSMQQAKVDARVGFPVPNPYYNPAGLTYDQKNSVMEDNNPFGLYNYPLYFDGDFYGNMYPKYHEQIDNPLLSIETHQDGTFYVDLCPGQLNLYGVFQNQYAQIGKIVKVEVRPNYFVYIRIGNIFVDYDQERIVIKGVVIRKPAAHVDDTDPGNIPVVTPEESGFPPPSPFDICYKWKNDGDAPTIVTYRDCNNVLVNEEVLQPGDRLCAFEIIQAIPATLLVTDSCDSGSESNPNSGSAIIPSTTDCRKVYRANLNQSGTDAPVASVYENTIGGITWARSGTGVYFGTTNVPGAFTPNHTWWQLNNTLVEDESVQIGLGIVRAVVIDDSTIVVVTRQNSTSGPVDEDADGLLVNASLEIIAYCQPDACELLGLTGFALKDGYLGVPYVVHLNEHMPHDPSDFVWITKPDWLNLFTEDNGDGTWYTAFGGTPGSEVDGDGTFPVEFTIGGCHISILVTIHVTGSYYIEWSVSVGSDVFNQRFSPYFSFNDGLPKTGVVDWGDNTFDPFVIASNSQFGHTFDSDGSWNVIFYFDTDSLFSTDCGIQAWVGDNSIIVGISGLSTNMTPSGVYILNVLGDLSNIAFPPSASLIELENLVSPPITLSFSVSDISAQLAGCSLFDGNIQTATVGWVNAVLVALDNNGLTGGSVTLLQATTPAPPSGAGITAKANLIGKGWTVTTD
jgi:hypothetical protein